MTLSSCGGEEEERDCADKKKELKSERERNRLLDTRRAERDASTQTLLCTFVMI
jgi:hypothetical protein